MMITCKEDLINTYIENDHGELRDLYLEKCEEFGIVTGCDADWFDWKYMIVEHSSSGHILNTVSDAPTCKQLTLSDLKPEEKQRTKVEYVKVNGNNDGGTFWECAKDYSEGVTFTTMGSTERLVIDDIDSLLDRYKCNNLYRRIETEIDERQEFIDSACNEVNATLDSYAAEDFARLYDSGKFKLVN